MKEKTTVSIRSFMCQQLFKLEYIIIRSVYIISNACLRAMSYYSKRFGYANDSVSSCHKRGIVLRHTQLISSNARSLAVASHRTSPVSWVTERSLAWWELFRRGTSRLKMIAISPLELPRVWKYLRHVCRLHRSSIPGTKPNNHWHSSKQNH